MLGIGTQEIARLHQDGLRRQAAVMHLAAARRPRRWRQVAGTALVRLGTHLARPVPDAPLGPALAPPQRARG